MSAAAVVLAGCSAGGGGDAPSTTVTPPDRLFVTLRGGGAPALRVQLDCAVADRDACVAVLNAVEAAQEQDGCTPVPDAGDASVLVTGTIQGEEVRQLVTRRTTCEEQAYDRVVSGAGL